MNDAKGAERRPQLVRGTETPSADGKLTALSSSIS